MSTSSPALLPALLASERAPAPRTLVDIFTSTAAEHPDALAQLHRQGKALYIGISQYPEQETREAYRILKEMGVPLLIHQPSYSILNRWIEDDGTIDACGELGIGMIPFSPLGQGVLTGKYSKGKAEGTRGAENKLGNRWLTPKVLTAVDALAKIAKARKQTMTQLALAWVLRRSEITSALIGVRTLEQLKDCLGAVDNLAFTDTELKAIDAATADAQLGSAPPTTLPD